MFPLSPRLVCEEERETKIFRSLSSSLLYLLKSPANSRNLLRQKIPHILFKYGCKIDQGLTHGSIAYVCWLCTSSFGMLSGSMIYYSWTYCKLTV